MKIEITGDAVMNLNSFFTVCKFCSNHDRENISLEINARENKIMFMCSKCRKMNEIKFGPAPHELAPPLPKTRVR